MREMRWNGYIEDELWTDEDITPDVVRENLFGVDGDLTDDVHVTLNSYGGSCNAATQIFDVIRKYPGKVEITVSGTAASAATVIAMAADRLEMTPGSIFMIHDPMIMACGNENDLMQAVDRLRTHKEAILNIYGTRTNANRDAIAGMMAKTTWMDAQTALDNGFIDAIAEKKTDGATNKISREEAEAKVRAWADRHKKAAQEMPQPKPTDEAPKGASVNELMNRLMDKRFI